MMVFTHKIVCLKSPKLYASYHDQTLQKTCFNLTERAAFNLPNNKVEEEIEKQKVSEFVLAPEVAKSVRDAMSAFRNR